MLAPAVEGNAIAAGDACDKAELGESENTSKFNRHDEVRAPWILVKNSRRSLTGKRHRDVVRKSLNGEEFTNQ